jgi:hypothetical protein
VTRIDYAIRTVAILMALSNFAMAGLHIAARHGWREAVLAILYGIATAVIFWR